MAKVLHEFKTKSGKVCLNPAHVVLATAGEEGFTSLLLDNGQVIELHEPYSKVRDSINGTGKRVQQ